MSTVEEGKTFMGNFMLAKLRSVVREEISTAFDAFEDRLMLTMGRYAQEVDKRFDRLEVRMDRIEGRMDGLEGRMDGLEQRMSGVEDRVVILDRKFDVLVERVNDHNVRLVRLEAKPD